MGEGEYRAWNDQVVDCTLTLVSVHDGVRAEAQQAVCEEVLDRRARDGHFILHW